MRANSNFSVRFSIPFTMFALLFLSPSPTAVVTQILGDIASSSPPLPTTVRALYFFREKISSRSSLGDSLALNCAYPR